MPLQEHMKLISVDDHLIEHPRVWSDRLPARHQEAGPRIVEIESATSSTWTSYSGQAYEGSQEVWLYEGRPYPQIGLNAVAGKERSQYGVEPTRYDEMIPGCYDPAARLRDMDLDGIHGQLCFPTFPRFSGTLFLEAEDKDLALLCVQAWNDFHLEEWCAHAPDRFIPMMLLPLWDPELCVREIHRCAAKGVRTISFPENTTSLGLGSFHDGSWDPVFAAAQDADLPISMHFGTSGSLPIPSPDSPFSVVISLMGCNSMHTMADLLFSPVFHTFPNLKVALSEGGIGWMPYLLERCDYTWERHMYYTGVNREVPPSELFKKHFWGCFIDDQHGVDSRESIGVDRIMWECDYPHSDSNWPHSRKRVEEQLRDVPDNEVHQMVELNARALYRFA